MRRLPYNDTGYQMSQATLIETETAALLQLDARDDVAIALRDLEAGERIEWRGDVLTVREPVPRGHKIAVSALAGGDAVHKFGWPIGVMRAAAAAGDHVHVHNVATGLAGIEGYAYAPALPE